VAIYLRQYYPLIIILVPSFNLRDQSDCQIYIVDANNTPSSRLLFEAFELPIEKYLLSSGDRQIALPKMSQTFQKEFLNIDKQTTLKIFNIWIFY
jgi:hypothetical protein